ncbi:VOC family protein [Mesobacillus subterraneus]|uniref:VOC family protein n=1 Tax=Mesobacillus subterraneus TaxID=285983 RepID=A0A427TWA8_9BACI|nr:VOC family protein [Mesobacillus subterraneus]RSD28787.1 VOC family protein [Mesobacillus subterraneus]
MIYEMTYQVRVGDFAEGLKWYTALFQCEPKFQPHAGFAEWEILPGCWLQVAEGTPTEGSGPLRLGVQSIEDEIARMVQELNMEQFEIFSREEVPVRWTTFSDPWGNRIGFFEYLDAEEMDQKINMVQDVVLGRNEIY